jgi:GrpB-like predicted nucleotidyltransferase (UPF0157 family)
MSHPITIVPYRDSWATEFSALSERMRTALGQRALRIEHVGSTSIAGLAAKDVIDVQVSVSVLDEHVGRSLAAIGLRADRSISGDHVPPGATGSAEEWRKMLFVEAPGDRRANIHVRAAGRLNERYALLFRDYLRAHPRVADAYAELKRRLSASLAVPDDYADVKDPAVDLIYLAAEQWAAATGWSLAPAEPSSTSE